MHTSIAPYTLTQTFRIDLNLLKFTKRKHGKHAFPIVKFFNRAKALSLHFIEAPTIFLKPFFTPLFFSSSSQNHLHIYTLASVLLCS